MNLTELLVAVAGWAGAVLILAAYLLLSMRRIAAESITYQVLNVAGAAGFIVNSGWHRAYPSAIVNVIWVGIGLGALARMLRAR